MPTYVYRCLTCENIFDKFQKISDPPPTCMSCGSSKTTKQVTAPAGISGSGGGWYGGGGTKR